MSTYLSDLEDIYFNLFDVYKIQEYSDQYDVQDFKDILDQYNKFIGQEIYPTRMISDEEGVKLTSNGVKVPACFHQANQDFYANGWYGLGYSEELGGIPAPVSIVSATTSLVCGANVSFSMYFGLARAAMNVLLKVGSQEQKDLFVPKMMEGLWGGTMCLTEAGAGSDVGALKTTATPNENGTYQIKGVKIFISSGDNDLYENIVHLVLARTPQADAGTKGLSLFIVPKMKINSDGSSGINNDVKCTKVEHKMGIHAQATCELTFGENNNCEGYLIGKECEGMANMFIMMNEARLMCGIQGEGQANLSYLMAKKYAGERSQFGKEIIHHPDIKRTLLKMRCMSRGLRSLILYTSSLMDQEHKDPSLSAEIALLTPICKSYASDMGFFVTVDAIQIHGGYGYCREYGIEQFARDTKIATIYEGTNGIQAIDFIVRKILKDNAQTFFNVGKKIEMVMKRPEAMQWEDELKMMARSMQISQEILHKYGKMAKGNNFDGILSSATDFLNYCGHLVVSWLLLEQACVAYLKLPQSKGEDEKKYLQSKIVDFKIFCQHYLVHNMSIGRSILKFEEDLTGLEV